MYAAFWERVQTKPEETVYSGMEEGLELIRSGPNVIHANYGELLGYFRANPFFSQNVKVFGKGRAEYFSLVLPFNSPLKPILQKGVNSMIEGGSVDHLLKLWEGKGIPVNAASGKMVLTAGQVFLVFALVFSTFSLAVLIFCCELLHKKMEASNQKPSKMKKPHKKSKFYRPTREFLNNHA